MANSHEKEPAGKPYDLLLLVDATMSMSIMIAALNQSLKEIVSVSALTGCFERIGVLAYRDYACLDVTEWSGWCSPSGKVSGPGIVSQDHVLSMASNLKTGYGGDIPEATKTGLAQAYSAMREEATTLILLYTDSPPHFEKVGGRYHDKEQRALCENTLYGKTDSLFLDWVSAAKTLRSGAKRGVVFSLVQKHSLEMSSPYLYLSTVTEGSLFEISELVATKISKLTLGLLLTWMQLGDSVLEPELKLGYLRKYLSLEGFEGIRDENDPVMDNFIVKTSKEESGFTNSGLEEVKLGDMPEKLQARGPKVENFAQQYASNSSYRQLCLDQLRRIIDQNVSAISINPVFGNLWRAVCSDRDNEDRNSLLAFFSQSIEKIWDANEKARMKKWLEESYNYAEEINLLIDSVSPEDRFPLLYLDPTEDFGTAEDDESDDKRPLQEFTREELLEIGRSCDFRILRRLGKVLTRLTYVNQHDKLPQHIKVNDSDKKVVSVPLALATEKYGRQFWKVLLHVVLPGTRLAARPAALLAALSLRMGIAPLRDAADRELLWFSKFWNNIGVPENWNSGCLNLILEADQDYEKRVSGGATLRPTPESRVLSEHDRDTFKTLVDYKILELNLKTTLQARIGWTPAKDKAPLGPLAICKLCKFPRSVTVMAKEGVCGLCVLDSSTCTCLACSKLTYSDEGCKKNVSVDQDERSMGYWVECAQTACRAQYVVYNPDKLRVRAKCFYCRHKGVDGGPSAVGEAPLVECCKCLSRMIWPEEYRPTDFDLSKFECAACMSGKETIVSLETSAHALSDENGREWLVRNDNDAIPSLFENRSLYFIASSCKDLGRLAANVTVIPGMEKRLTIGGKLVRNQEQVTESLRGWVSSRKAETSTCSLCFSDFRKPDILPACGRSGCHQEICQGCRKDWYGINAAGRIINVAALQCPFCRRQPTPKVASPYNLHRVLNLRAAFDESGAWIYAWCSRCWSAKQYVERVCAAGAPPQLTGWRCEACEEERLNPQGLKPVAKPIPMCPGCGVATEKTYGCDHITCPCGTHWCYECGKAVGEDRIYRHMAIEHGGMSWGYDYFDEEYDDDEEEEEEEEN